MSPSDQPVVLAGAGPGDPDLLTLRAEAALAAAGLVVTDPGLVPLAAAFAPRADVVAGGADPEATATMLAERRRRTAAVRLYRGDPWLHPLYAAEAAALARRGVATEAVPGSPVETALAGAAGLALHHRPVAVTLTLGAIDTGDGPGRTLACEVDDLRAAGTLLSGRPWAAVVDGQVARDDLPAGAGLLVVGDVAK
jgi:siroheme synthase